MVGATRGMELIQVETEYTSAYNFLHLYTKALMFSLSHFLTFSSALSPCHILSYAAYHVSFIHY